MMGNFVWITYVYFAAILASVVVLFWLAITAIRAMNVYIRKNREPHIGLE